MRCDLHVHSLHSGFTELALLRHLARECYSEPRAVYDRARRRGMDLVTLTDHDSIAGALELLSLPGTFVSEELTCHLPAGRQLHLGVYGVDERRHEALQARRCDPEALLAYLAEERLPACLNHPFSPLTGGRASEDLDLALRGVRLVEGLNGMLPARTNGYAARAASDSGHAQVGGSDAHALASVARAWTEVPGARDAGEFLDGLRQGCCVPRGSSGTYARLTRDLLTIAIAATGDALTEAGRGALQAARCGALLALAPGLLFLPLVAARLRVREHVLAARFFNRWHRSRARVGPWAALWHLPEAGR